jgi:hypothetical protein
MDIIKELEDIGNLYKDGAITKDEFESMKAEIINSTLSQKQTNPNTQSIDRPIFINNPASERHEANGDSVYSTGYQIGKFLGLLKSKHPKLVKGFIIVMIVIGIGSIISKRGSRSSISSPYSPSSNSNSSKNSSSNSNTSSSSSTYYDKNTVYNQGIEDYTNCLNGGITPSITE